MDIIYKIVKSPEFLVIETLFAGVFTITFKTKLDGKDENAAMKFEPIKK